MKGRIRKCLSQQLFFPSVVVFGVRLVWCDCEKVVSPRLECEGRVSRAQRFLGSFQSEVAEKDGVLGGTQILFFLCRPLG